MDSYNVHGHLNDYIDYKKLIAMQASYTPSPMKIVDGKKSNIYKKRVKKNVPVKRKSL